MFNKPKQRGAIVTGVLSNHGLSKEDIQELSDYIDSRGRELTRPLVWGMIIGFGILAILILLAPGLLQDLIKGNLGL